MFAYLTDDWLHAMVLRSGICLIFVSVAVPPVYERMKVFCNAKEIERLPQAG